VSVAASYRSTTPLITEVTTMPSLPPAKIATSPTVTAAMPTRAWASALVEPGHWARAETAAKGRKAESETSWTRSFMTVS